MSSTRKTGLELVAQAGQFGQIGVVKERLAQACLVIAELRLCDGRAVLTLCLVHLALAVICRWFRMRPKKGATHGSGNGARINAGKRTLP